MRVCDRCGASEETIPLGCVGDKTCPLQVVAKEPIGGGVKEAMCAALTTAMLNPAIIPLLAALNDACAQAAAVGMSKEFEVAWKYEAERSKQTNHQAPTPAAILSVLLQSAA